jgi:hypothetical protein
MYHMICKKIAVSISVGKHQIYNFVLLLEDRQIIFNFSSNQKKVLSKSKESILIINRRLKHFGSIRNLNYTINISTYQILNIFDKYGYFIIIDLHKVQI